MLKTTQLFTFQCYVSLPGKTALTGDGNKADEAMWFHLCFCPNGVTGAGGCVASSPPSSAVPGPPPPTSLHGIPSQITNSFALRVLSANKSQSGLGFRLSGQLGELEQWSTYQDGEMVRRLCCALYEK